MSTGYSPDSAAVNTAPPSLFTQAFADISADASVSADITYVFSGETNLPASGSVTVGSTRTAFAGAAPLGSVNVIPRQTKIHAAAAVGGASAGIVASVLRIINDVAASALCTGSILAIPADTLGNSNIDNNVASVTGEATRIQFGETPNNLCLATLSAAPVAARLSPVNIAGSASIYVTGGINNVYDSFVDFTGTGGVAVQLAGLRNTFGAIETFENVATASGEGTIIQPGAAQPASNASTLIPDGSVIISPGLNFTGDATIVADAIRGIPVEANISASAGSSADVNQGFAAEVVALADAGMTAVGTRTTFEEAIALTVSIAFAEAEIIKVAESAPAAQATFSAVGDRETFTTVDASLPQALLSVTGLRTLLPEAATTGGAAVAATGLRTVRPTSNVLGVVPALGADGVIFKAGEAAVAANAQFDAIGLILRSGEADLGGVCTIDADSVANPASFDPPERTFIKPPGVFDFVRPSTEFEFRRVA